MISPEALAPPLPDVVEDGATFEANAEKKAAAWARFAGLHALADDSGLCVDALGGAPGVYSARWSELEPAPSPASPVCDLAEVAVAELGPVAGRAARDERNNDKLLRSLAGVPDEGRGAEYRAVLSLACPDGALVATVRGVCRGRVGHERRGAAGSGTTRSSSPSAATAGRWRSSSRRRRTRSLTGATRFGGSARSWNGSCLTGRRRDARDGVLGYGGRRAPRDSRGVAQPGSAPALGAGGRGSESRRPDSLKRWDGRRARSSRRRAG